KRYSTDSSEQLLEMSWRSAAAFKARLEYSRCRNEGRREGRSHYSGQVGGKPLVPARCWTGTAGHADGRQAHQRRDLCNKSLDRSGRALGCWRRRQTATCRSSSAGRTGKHEHLAGSAELLGIQAARAGAITECLRKPDESDRSLP